MKTDLPHSPFVWSGYTLAAFCCLVFSFAAAREVWPPMEGDGAMLFPSAVELARGNGFVNTPWLPPMNDTIDGPGGRRHISHGFLNQLLVGMAASVTGADARQCVAWSHVTVLLAAIVCGAAVLSWRRGSPKLAFVAFILGFVSVSGAFALAFAWFGRMEAMVMLWVGCAMLSLRFLPSNASFVACGGALGLMAWTSPVSAVVGALFMGIYIFVRAHLATLKALLLVAVGGLATTFLSLSIYPYSLDEWIGGTIRHSHIHFDHPPFRGLLQTWVARPHIPLLIVTVGLLITVSLIRVGRLLQPFTLWRKLLVWGGCAALLVALFRLSIMRGEAAYNVVAFIPVLAAICLGAATICARISVLVALMLPTLGLARSALLLKCQIADGPAYQEINAVIAEKTPDGLLISKGLWLAVPDLKRVTFGRPSTAQTRPRWFIDQQLATGRSAPPDYSGYRVIENKFAGPVRVFGFPISRTPTGWQYALYEKVSSGD